METQLKPRLWGRGHLGPGLQDTPGSVLCPPGSCPSFQAGFTSVTGSARPSGWTPATPRPLLAVWPGWTGAPRWSHPFPGVLPLKEQREQTLATVALLAGAALAPTRLQSSKRSVFSGASTRVPAPVWRRRPNSRRRRLPSSGGCPGERRQGRGRVLTADGAQHKRAMNAGGGAKLWGRR